jgi:putative endonuclease
MANDRPTLYTGVTSQLVKRVYDHKNDLVDGFTKRYQLHKLVYFEVVEGEMQGIIREKQVKDMNRKDKLELIKLINPTFEDLYTQILSDSGCGLRPYQNDNIGTHHPQPIKEVSNA